MSADGQKWVCVHGHFYQPPREEPWRETVEREPSARPYHDWNERVTAECYAPNARARILGPAGLVEQLVNNYARMSFNFGPTLLSWLERERRDVYEAILEGDRESLSRFDGHGGAIAQAYSHLILPLANPRDVKTQVVWGIRDFQRRFHRSPEGMWLPETAVDLRTLVALAAEGLRFTILAPRQARRVRDLAGGEWREVAGGAIDTSVPYLVCLPGGGEISVFFYDAAISLDVAFGGLLGSGEKFAQRLLGAFRPERSRPQLVHVATDGESYGHHSQFGEMGLAYALDRVRKSERAQLTDYGAFLEKFPPTEEVEILENTSWSCVHGVERWRADCGCTTGGEPGWSQAWRRPLRQALDRLSGRLGTFYERAGTTALRDVWGARDAAVGLADDPSSENRERFLSEQGLPSLDPPARRRALALVEMERQAMLMFTSCGWFFSDLAGGEAIQILRHAARAIELAEALGERGVEEEFLRDLAGARSNRAEEGDGRKIYERHVRPDRCGIEEVAAAAALARLVGGEARMLSTAHDVQMEVLEEGTAPGGREVRGTVSVWAPRMAEAKLFRFLAVDSGFGRLAAEIKEGEGVAEGGTREASAGDSLRLTPATLPPDVQRRLLALAAGAAERALRAVIAEEGRGWDALVMQLVQIEEPVPPATGSIASAVAAWRIVEALTSDADPSHAGTLILAARNRGLLADSWELETQVANALTSRALAWAEAPLELDRLRSILAMAQVVRDAFPTLDRSRAQWLYQGVVRRSAMREAQNLAAAVQMALADLGRALGMEDPVVSG